jgi:hypothetical protein
MNEQQKHEMVLETTHPSGAEEWYCPTCERRMTITWQPWKKIILEPGDIHATHGGSKGMLKIGLLQINQEHGDGPPSATEPFVEDPSLDPWMRWLDKMNWNDFGNEIDSE